jgi:hypothetical protein
MLMPPAVRVAGVAGIRLVTSEVTINSPVFGTLQLKPVLTVREATTP